MEPCEARVKGRVLILTGESADAPGGMEHVIRELANGLGEAGFAVEVFHSQNSGPKWISRPQNKWQSYLRDFLLSWYLGRRIAAEKTNDVVAVISNGPFGWYIPRIRPEIKRIHFYHGTYRGQAGAIARFLSRAGALKLQWWDSMVLERLSGRRKRIVCNSDQTREEVLGFFGYSGQTVWVPLNTAHFRPMDKAASRQKLGLVATEKVGLFVGNTHPTKGFPIVRALIDALPDVRWVLALRGEVPGELRDYAGVLIFPDAAYDLLPLLYNAADFALCPSLYEAFGYVVAEALACGTPVVSSPGGASRLFLSAPPFERFLIKQVDSVNDYRTAITAILADPEFHRRSVIDLIRPELQTILAPANWLRHFGECTGI
jgi:glycosyltransferase involved in cell wall biosynthesis